MVVYFLHGMPVNRVEPDQGGTCAVHDTVELKVGDRVPGFIFRDTAKQEMSLKQFKWKICRDRRVGIVVLPL